MSLVETKEETKEKKGKTISEEVARKLTKQEEKEIQDAEKTIDLIYDKFAQCEGKKQEKIDEQMNQIDVEHKAFMEFYQIDTQTLQQINELQQQCDETSNQESRTKQLAAFLQDTKDSFHIKEVTDQIPELLDNSLTDAKEIISEIIHVIDLIEQLNKPINYNNKKYQFINKTTVGLVSYQLNVFQKLMTRIQNLMITQCTRLPQMIIKIKEQCGQTDNEKLKGIILDANVKQVLYHLKIIEEENDKIVQQCKQLQLDLHNAGNTMNIEIGESILSIKKELFQLEKELTKLKDEKKELQKDIKIIDTTYQIAKVGASVAVSIGNPIGVISALVITASLKLTRTQLKTKAKALDLKIFSKEKEIESLQILQVRGEKIQQLVQIICQKIQLINGFLNVLECLHDVNTSFLKSVQGLEQDFTGKEELLQQYILKMENQEEIQKKMEKSFSVFNSDIQKLKYHW